MRISELGGETALINLIREKYGAAGEGDLVLGIGDDAALIGADTNSTIVTADLLVENTHFRMDITEPYLLGWKSVAVSISDIAAMGGRPTYAFISIGLPDVDIEIVEGIYQGMYDVSAAFGSVIAGGDTVGSGCGIVINVTQLGTVETRLAARRSGAETGDAVIVTNTLGDSRAGLELLLRCGLGESRRISGFLVDRHLKPEPRVYEAEAVVRTGRVHSMMDLSDGLSSDIAKLCSAAGVGARVYASALPVSKELQIAAARLDADPLSLAASGGEDYELLVTCGPRDAAGVMRAIEDAGSSAKTIGEITDGDSAVFVHANGSETPMPGSWEHF